MAFSLLIVIMVAFKLAFVLGPLCMCVCVVVRFAASQEKKQQLLEGWEPWTSGSKKGVSPQSLILPKAP